MLKKTFITIKVFFLIVFLISCNQEESFQWVLTKNNNLKLWTNDKYSIYIWEGESIDSIIHGKGVLSVFQNDKLLKKIKYTSENPLFYGAIDKNGIEKIEEDFYVGETKDRLQNGFGVYIKNDEVYIGYFKNGKPDGKNKKYKKNKLIFDGDWLNGKKNGFGTFYQSDGLITEGIWINGKLDYSENQTLKTEQGEYLGSLKDGKQNGKGKFTFKDSSIYIGNWNNGKYDGYGLFIFPNKDSIDGFWKNGKLHGEVNIISKKFEFEGEYQNDLKNGFGIISYNNGNLYSGDWLNGKMDGYGSLFINSIIEYDGEFEQGLPNGLGSYNYLNLENYVGAWKKGLPDGMGVFENIQYKYDGSFKAGLFNGFGNIEYKKSKEKYRGYFKDGLKDSIGNYSFFSGNNYIGNFKDDKFNGLGVFTFKDGSNYQGEFKNGLFYGEGTLFLKNNNNEVSITGNWNGDSKLPEVTSILFPNGDLYEGEIINGLPSKNGIWSSSEERLKEEQNEQIKKDNRTFSERSKDFYDRNKDTFREVLDKTTLVLDIVEVAALGASAILAPTLVGTVVAGNIFFYVKGLNIALHSLKVVMSSNDLIDALGGGENGKKLLIVSKDFLLEIVKTNEALYNSLIENDSAMSEAFKLEFQKFAIKKGIDREVINKIDEEKLNVAFSTLVRDIAMTTLTALPGSPFGKSIGKLATRSIKLGAKSLKPLFKSGAKYQKIITVNFSKGFNKVIQKVGSKSTITKSNLFLKKTLETSLKASKKVVDKLKSKRISSNKIKPKNNIKPKNSKKPKKDRDGIPYKLINWQKKQLSGGKKFTFIKNKRSITIIYKGLTKARVYSIGSYIKVSVGNHFDGRKMVNPVISGPLIRKATYIVNSGIYFTDNKSRPKMAILPVITKGMTFGEIDRYSIEGKSESEIAREHDGLGGGIDDGGHLIAHTLGGVKASINIVPQLGSLNRGTFKIIENFVKSNKIHVKKYLVEVSYKKSSSSFRPDDFYQSFYFSGDQKKLKELEEKLFKKGENPKIIKIGDSFKFILGTSNIPTEILENTFLQKAA